MNYSPIALNHNTLVDILRYRAAHQSEQIAYTFLVDGESQEVSLTYQQLDQQARAIASQLQSFCQLGERALLLYPPGLDYIAAFFGCLYGGVIAVPAYPPRPKRSLLRLQAIIKDAQPTLALTTNPILSSLEQRLDHAPQLETIGWLATDELNYNYANDWKEVNLSSDTIAFLQYTSGSTAAPKGVMVSHGNLIHNSAAIYQYFQHSDHSKVVTWLPLYHDMGLIGGVLQPLYGGFPATVMSPFMFLQRPLRWLETIAQTGATSSGGPNFAYDLCMRKIKPDQLPTLDLSSWDVAFNGAEPINPQTLEQFATTFAPWGFRREAFYPCYGMAEATLIVSGGLKTAPPVTKIVQSAALEKNQVISEQVEGQNTRTLVGCGQTIPEQTIAIIDPEKLTPCSPTQVGEIWVSGASIAQGYWNQSQMTQEAFHASLNNTTEPFLRTGDLGFLADGELFVTGRLKDVIIINGRNHYPQDIELSVEQCHPAIRPTGTAAFSVVVSGEEQLVVVAELEHRYFRELQRANKATNNSNQPGHVEIKDVIASVRRAISQHHDLQVYEVLLLKPGTISKTSSGKIQRHACRANFLAGTLKVVDNTF